MPVQPHLHGGLGGGASVRGGGGGGWAQSKPGLLARGRVQTPCWGGAWGDRPRPPKPCRGLAAGGRVVRRVLRFTEL